MFELFINPSNPTVQVNFKQKQSDLCIHLSFNSEASVMSTQLFDLADPGSSVVVLFVF